MGWRKLKIIMLSERYRSTQVHTVSFCISKTLENANESIVMGRSVDVREVGKLERGRVNTRALESFGR